MKKLKDFYFHLSCPSINGIAFPDGSAIQLLFNITWVPKIAYKIIAERSMNYDNIEAHNELNWKDCGVMCSLEIDEKGVLIISGESDYGSDGFVAALNSKSKLLIWIGIFDTSNPFNKLRYEKETNCILAFSTNGSIWRFPLDKPHELSTETSD